MTKRLITLLVAVFIVPLCFAQEHQSSNIRLNQLGYYPGASKKAIVTNTKSKTFSLKNSDGKLVFEGKLKKAGYWDKSGEDVKIADFSSFTKQGEFYIDIEGIDPSFKFKIRKNLYDEAFKAALKSYYLIRASMEIEEEYAGIYRRAMGHPDTNCFYHPSTDKKEGSISSSKGWYDAGDYNKYVVNGGVTVGTLLNLYDMFPDLVGDGFTNIPESKNGQSDLLDEVKYELDWVMSMQAEDGASYFKLTSKKFSDFIMPSEEHLKRYVVGKSTAATLNLAAMTAQASRLYKDYDINFANQCKIAAEKAWAWAIKNPEIVFKNPGDISTGEYSDVDFTEEFWWAAAELFLASGKQEYLDYLDNHEPYMKMVVGESWRQFLGNIGSFSLLLSDDHQLENIKKQLSTQLITAAEKLLKKLNSNPYRIAIDDFRWGSNSDIQNTAIIFAYAYKLSGDKKYLDAVVETMDYIFGKNATAYSFMTGYGSKQVMNMHNRISGADNIDQPLPGLIAGGPNSRKQDEKRKDPFGVKYPFNEPAKSYVDMQASYASNENCINWNAPAVFVLGFLQTILASAE